MGFPRVINATIVYHVGGKSGMCRLTLGERQNFAYSQTALGWGLVRVDASCKILTLSLSEDGYQVPHQWSGRGVGTRHRRCQQLRRPTVSGLTFAWQA